MKEKNIIIINGEEYEEVKTTASDLFSMAVAVFGLSLLLSAVLGTLGLALIGIL